MWHQLTRDGFSLVQQTMRLAHAILDALPAHIALLDATGAIVMVNKAWRDFANDNGAHAVEVSEGCNYLAVCDKAASEGCQQAGVVAANIRALQASRGSCFRAEYLCDAPNVPRWFSMEVTGVEFEGTRYVVVRHTEITALRQTAMALDETEAKYASILANVPVYILLIDERSTVKFINRIDTPDLTAEQVLGRSLNDAIAPEFRQVAKGAITAAFERGETSNFKLNHRRKDGSLRWFAIRVGPLRSDEDTGHVIWCASDITDQHTTEEQLLQAQKMDSIGQLAGGIAHDFNNLLTAIIGHAELLRLHTTDANHERSALILSTARRAADLTSKLLAFSRKQVLQPMRINLNDVIADVVQLISRLIGREIIIETRLEPSLSSVLADPTQIEQVLINLAVNARDAMPDGGTLTIGSDMIEAEQGGKPLGMKPGRYVVITVADTGSGMDAATLARSFEPFFTTKEKGKGTGLGLAVVHGIVKQSGGYVSVESEVGKGTIFYLCFPISKGTAEVLPRRTAPVPTTRGHEQILLVDDEPTVREIASEIIQSFGYQVTAAPNGEVALDLAKKRITPFDLVIADVSMPGLSGPELANQLRISWPQQRVLLASGYSDTDVLNRSTLGTLTWFLQKPFGVNQLGAKIREVLDSPASGPKSLDNADSGQGI